MEAAKADATKRNVRRCRVIKNPTNVLTMYFRNGPLPLMKKVLSLLVAFVFLQVQTWALSGGPFDSAGNNLVGTYAGTLVGSIPLGGAVGIGGAGLGIFTIGLPQGGIGTGLFALYSGGFTITGDVIGIGDPQEQKINGVMAGDFIPTEDVTGGVVFGGGVTSLGAQFEAKIKTGRTLTGGGVTISGTAGATITQYFPFANQVSTDFVLTGYKQSADPTAAVSIALPQGD